MEKKKEVFVFWDEMWNHNKNNEKDEENTTKNIVEDEKGKS